MNTTDKIYKALPGEFTKSQLLQTGKRENISLDASNYAVSKLLFDGKIERLSKGNYRKTN